jgi:hypothetical protein
MAIYEVDGVTYDIPTDDPEVAKQKIREHLGMAAPKAGSGEEPEPNLAPQGLAAARGVAGPIAPVVAGATNMAVGSVKDIGKMGSILYNNLTPSIVGEFIGSPITKGKELVSAYVAGHPWMNQAMNVTPKQAVQAAGGLTKNIATGLGAGLLGPESAFSAPYQMAAYEQEKIRANPTAPEYATNPYAQMYRGEAKTQGSAGAVNTRNAVAGQQYGGVTPQEQNMLDQDRLNRMIREAAAKKALAFPNQ